MDKIIPPEFVQNESKSSVEYILNLGPDEPSEYTDVSDLASWAMMIVFHCCYYF